MAYDGRILRRAVQKFEEDRRAREQQFQTRREVIFRRQPRLREIESELSGTASRIIAAAMRRGTDPLPAVEVLRDENLGLQAEKRRLLSQMGYPEDALEEAPVSREYQSREKVSKLWVPRSSIRESSFCCSRA